METQQGNESSQVSVEAGKPKTFLVLMGIGLLIYLITFLSSGNSSLPGLLGIIIGGLVVSRLIAHLYSLITKEKNTDRKKMAWAIVFLISSFFVSSYTTYRPDRDTTGASSNNSPEQVSAVIPPQKQNAVLPITQLPIANNSDFDLQSKCSEISANLAKTSFPHSTYLNNYVSNLGKCMVEIITIKKDTRREGWDYSARVIDATTGPAGHDYAVLEMYVDYDLNNGALGVSDVCSPIKSACEAVTICFVGSKSCDKTSGVGSQYYSFNSLVGSTYGIR